MPFASPHPIQVALVEWQLGIRDPEVDDKSEAAGDAREFVTEYLRGGFGWPKAHYRGNGTYKWCGAFAAWCYRLDVSQEHRRSFASTWRLRAWGRKNLARCVAFSDIKPGDIVCVGDGDYGSHIALAVAWDARLTQLVTISGNGGGRLPDGSWGEGVVMTVYPRSAIRAAYRPLESDRG